MRFLLLTAILLAQPALAAECYSLSIQNLPLNEGNRIASVDLTIEGGYVSSVKTIPFDWQVNINSSLSPRATFWMHAIHGVAFLDDITLLHEFIVICKLRHSFSISSKVDVYKTADDDFETIELNSKQLLLEKREEIKP